MKPTRLPLCLAAAAALVLLPSGCSSYQPDDNSQYVAFDAAVNESVAYLGAKTSRTPDGRLEVVAQLRNLLPRRIEVQVDCVFKDAAGIPTNDEAPFQTLILTENATEPVRFTSLNAAAQKFTVRVRQAR